MSNLYVDRRSYFLYIDRPPHFLLYIVTLAGYSCISTTPHHPEPAGEMTSDHEVPTSLSSLFLLVSQHLCDGKDGVNTKDLCHV